MNNLSYLYELYNINYVKSTDDLSYAINWMLRYLLTNNYDSKIIIKSYSNHSNNSNNCIYEGVLTYDKTINRIVKHTDYDTIYPTIYSPYDTTIFFHTHNSNLYKQIIYNNNNKVSTNQISNNQVTNNINTIKEDKPKQSIKDLFSSIIDTSEKLKKVSNELNENNESQDKQNNENKEEKNSDVDSESDSDSESINSEELEQMQKHLDKLLEDKVNIDNLVKERDEVLTDLRCEDSFQKRKQVKLKEKEEEKKNIFRGDLGVYKKILEKYNKCLEDEELKDKQLESFIPPLFEAKFYIFHFLNFNDLINDSDYENPSDELYELYTILYSSRYNEFYEIPEEFEDIISEFINFLPEKNILTEEEIHNGLNDASRHDLLFVQREEEEDLVNNLD
jgi:hypothetical protein